MSRLLFKGEWYEEISPASLYETQFEALIFENANLLYPGYSLVPFKITVFSDEGGAKADFALIDGDYKCWWVVEVEMGNHSFKGHVDRQVRILSEATYGEQEALHLFAQCPTLDIKLLKDLMKGNQPRVLVLVNFPCPEWVHPLRKYDALLSVFQVFRSPLNKHIFRLNGDSLPRNSNVLTSCSMDPHLPGFLVLHSPAVLGIAPGTEITLLYKEQTSLWRRFDVKDKAWLICQGRSPLPPKQTFDILLRHDGALSYPRFRRHFRKGTG